MSFDAQWVDMLPQTIAYSAYVGNSTDGYGTNTHTTSSKNVRCRIQAVRADIRSTITHEVAGASFKIITAPYSTVGTSDTITISVLDKIALPAGFVVSGSTQPPILRAYPVQDETGHHHNEVWL